MRFMPPSCSIKCYIWCADWSELGILPPLFNVADSKQLICPRIPHSLPSTSFLLSLYLLSLFGQLSENPQFLLVPVYLSSSSRWKCNAHIEPEACIIRHSYLRKCYLSTAFSLTEKVYPSGRCGVNKIGIGGPSYVLIL